MVGAEKVYLFTVDSGGQLRFVGDVKNLHIKTWLYGFLEATWDLEREFGFAYEDIGLNFEVIVYSGRGDIAWQGRLDTISPALNNGVGSMSCVAVGYWASASDLSYNGTLATSTTPEAMLISLITGGYLPQLASTTTGILTTGLTNRGYKTGNYGADDVAVAEAILTICGYGNSAGQVVFPAVWENRVLSTYFVDVTNPTVEYICHRDNILSIGLSRSLSSVSNRVTTRYKDSATANLGNLSRATVNDSASQTALSVVYPGNSSATPFIKQQILDYTGLQNTDSTTATTNATNVLSNSKRVKNDGTNIQIGTEYAIYSVTNGQERAMWAIRSGNWFQSPNLLPRSSVSGTGSTGGDAALQNYFLMSQTDYDVDAGVITITPESAIDLQSLLS